MSATAVMVSRTAVQIEALAFVLGVSLAPVLAGHAIRGRGRPAQAIATAVFALLGAVLGAHLYSGRAHGVPGAQALAGAALAGGLLVAVPAALYLQLGYRLRPLWLAAGVWVASAVPLVLYLLVVALAVREKLECPPGESCSLFG